MALYELVLPKMGESVAEATIIKWLKKSGDKIDIDESVLEIATDKVDSEVPSPVSGKLLNIFFKENDVVQVGAVIATIELESELDTDEDIESEQSSNVELPVQLEEYVQNDGIPHLYHSDSIEPVPSIDFSNAARFYSPLVKSMAAEEGISTDELDRIKGTGSEGRVTKKDILDFINSGKTVQTQTEDKEVPIYVPTHESVQERKASPVSVSGGDEIIEMDRMRKLIADHMVMSKQTSAHVTSFVEADVTNLVQWRDRIKSSFEKREGEKITFTPIFIEAVAKVIKDLPMINISVNGTQIIKKRDINIGMAAALPSGNLIVPVIKNADQLNLFGLTKAVNDLASRSRLSKLKPDETQGGTFTLTNLGTFGNIMGTPIINQPQVAVLAVGAIKKKPAVMETEYGDVIAIRHMMFLSLSYDHRVVDGSLGGSFVRRVADYLESWDINREL
jgi:2-oxoglutarate dehydrogenase E2 component (dihydrolipoamide succinyltransferase)